MNWLTQSNNVTSKGLTSKKATRMADLAKRRQETQSQYFTPLWISLGFQSILATLTERTTRKITVMDNSVGSGRLLANTNPDKHILFGCDVDERVIDTLSQDAKNAGFTHTFFHDGMENIKARNIDVGLINPPFSITLASPNMQPFNCTTYGKYGPHTHALSQQYSLEHALDSCSVVIALLPMSMRDICRNEDRLLAEIQLPNDTFKDEGANVNTSVYVFGKNKNKANVGLFEIKENESWPVIEEIDSTTLNNERAIFSQAGIEHGKPTITLPVTGDNRVILHHHNRRIVIKYACGLTQAKVANALMKAPVERDRHRYPQGINYIGSGLLFLDVHLKQDDPQASFNSVLDVINESGGQAIVTDTLAGFWAKCVKRLKRDQVPFRKTIKESTSPSITVIAKRTMLLEQCNTQAPIVKKGEVLQAEVLGGVYLISKDSFTTEFRRDHLLKFFTIDEQTEQKPQWKTVFEGKNKAFPELAHANRAIAKASGVDFMWEPQLESLSELMMTTGAVAGHQQGTGKARLAIALCLTSTAKHNLIVVESGLVDEMIREFKKINLSPDLYHVIRSVSDIENLSKVNVISYNRLKASAGKDMGKRTISHLLRRRFGLIAADEGGILSNPDSLQSRALKRLAPKKLFLLDGTPLGNYPRQILPLACATRGSSTATQPYAMRNGLHIEKRLATSANYASRGIEQFKDDFVVLDWASQEFSDNLKDGAKREIPMIKDVPLFRQWAASFVQRRLRNEPEMQPYTGCEDPERETIKIEWDKAHFKHYLKVAVEYADWYIKHKADRELEGKGSNLVAVLARINAVIKAANNPHTTDDGMLAKYTPLTSKQKYAIDRMVELACTGGKSILYAYSPAVLERFHVELKKRGVKSVLFTGKQNIKNRNAQLDNEFRFGDAPILLSSWVGQRGLNLEQANRVIMYSRHWSGDTEEQAIARVIRPDQTKQVYVEYLELDGSIDEYMAQVVEWKIAAADAGLDFGDATTNAEEFMHLDNVLEAFCRKTLEISSYEANRMLAA
jgi:hypothetical protein